MANPPSQTSHHYNSAFPRESRVDSVANFFSDGILNIEAIDEQTAHGRGAFGSVDGKKFSRRGFFVFYTKLREHRSGRTWPSASSASLPASKPQTSTSSAFSSTSTAWQVLRPATASRNCLMSEPPNDPDTLRQSIGDWGRSYSAT